MEKFNIAKAIEEELPEENKGAQPLKPEEFKKIRNISSGKSSSPVVETLEKMKRRKSQDGRKAA